MEKKIFWQHALKGGTIIAVALIVVSAIRMLLPAGLGIGFLFSLVNIALFVYFVHRFCKEMSRMASPAEGYSIGQCVSFSLCMMIFTGVLMALFTILYNTVINPGAAEQAMEQSMGIMERFMPYGDADAMYETMERSMKIARNPMFMLFTTVVSYMIYGAIVGLIVGTFVKREPDTFADNDGE